jgi:hypothetical protein
VGPSHWLGQYFDPDGWIDAVEFDGLTLWGRPKEIVLDGVGRITDNVARGRVERSIGFHYCDPAAPGGALLIHLALTGGEVPGQRGLPPLPQHLGGLSLASTEGARLHGQLAPVVGQEMATRFVELPLASRTYAPSTNARGGQEDDMDEATLQRILGTHAESSRTALQTDVTALLAPIAERVNGLPAAITAEVTTATAPLVERLNAIDTALVEVRTAAQTATTTTTEHALAAVAAGNRTFVQSLVDSFRLAPSEVDATIQALNAMPAEPRETYKRSLSQRPKMAGSRSSVVLIGADNAPVDIMSQLPAEIGNEFLADGSYEADNVRLTVEAITRCGGYEAVRKNPQSLLRVAGSLANTGFNGLAN